MLGGILQTGLILFGFWFLLFNVFSFTIFLLWRIFAFICKKRKQILPAYYSLHIIEIITLLAGIVLFIYVYQRQSYAGYFLPVFGTKLFMVYAYAAGAVWVVAESAIIIHLFRQHRTIPHIKQTDAPSPDTLKLAEAIANQLSIKRTIPIRVISSFSTPFLRGTHSPTIFLTILDEDDPSLKYMLAHEMVHYKHKDLLFRKLFLALEIMTPLIVFLRNDMIQIEEMMCDHAVITMEGANEKEYQTTLLEVAARAAAEMTPDQAICYVESKAGKHLKERILMLQHPIKEKKTKALLLVCGTLILFTAASLSSAYAVQQGTASAMKKVLYDPSSAEADFTPETAPFTKVIRFPASFSDMPATAASGQFQTTVKPGETWNTGSFWLELNAEFTFSVYIDHPSSEIRIGILATSGVFTYTLGDEHVKAFTFSSLAATNYYLVVFNDSSDEVTITGFYEGPGQNEEDKETVPASQELFSIDNLPPYANELLNQWRQPKGNVLERLGWSDVEPLEGSEIYYINGSVPEEGPIFGVISDGTIDYGGGQWGLKIQFSQGEEPALGLAQYEIIAQSAEEATKLMDEVTSLLLQTLGEPIDSGHGHSYVDLENREEAVQALVRNKALINAWDITPEGAGEAEFYRLILWVTPCFDAKGKEQFGYAIKLKFSTTMLENWY